MVHTADVTSWLDPEARPEPAHIAGWHSALKLAFSRPITCWFSPDPGSGTRPEPRSHSTSLPTSISYTPKMSISHGIRTLGVLGAGQMGTGIALVSALRAKVPVLLHDRSSEQVAKGLSLVDKLLAKNVAKGRITSDEAKDARERITVVGADAGIKGLRDVDMVIEVRGVV